MYLNVTLTYSYSDGGKSFFNKRNETQLDVRPGRSEVGGHRSEYPTFTARAVQTGSLSARLPVHAGTSPHSYLVSSLPPPVVYLLTESSVLTSTPLLQPQQPDQQKPFSSRTSAFPGDCCVLTTTRPGPGVALPVYRVGADTDAGSQRPIQRLAYEIPSSAVIPYTSSAYSHIQEPGVDFLSGRDIAEWRSGGRLGTDEAAVFSFIFKGVLSLPLGKQPQRS